LLIREIRQALLDREQARYAYNNYNESHEYGEQEWYGEPSVNWPQRNAQSSSIIYYY
jgi:hypothetical protein